MNKIFHYSFLAGVAALSLASCQNEEADIFDKSAAERLNEASEVYASRLIDGSAGWSMQYYVSTESDIDDMAATAGYLLLAEFKDDYSVRVAMNNYFTGNKFDQDTSAWQVITDMGAVLSFNTYNRLLHRFSIPENYAGLGEYDDATGKGMGGDYEFVMVKVPEGGDHILLKGKKSKAYTYLTRLEAGVDFEDYLSSVNSMQSRLLPSSAPNHLVMNIGGKEYYMIMNGSKVLGDQGIAKIWPAGTDSVFTNVLNPLIMTRRVAASDTSFVIRFRDAIEGNEGVSAQEFAYKPASQTFVSTDEEQSECTIQGQPAEEFFAETWALSTTYIFASKGSSDKVQEVLSAVAAAYKGVKYTFQKVDIQRTNESTATVSISYRTNKSATAKAKYTFNYSISGNTLTLAYVEPVNTASANQLGSLTAIGDLLSLLTGDFTILPAGNALDLSTIAFQSNSDSSLLFNATNK